MIYLGKNAWATPSAVRCAERHLMKKMLHEKSRLELLNEKASLRYDERLLLRRRRPAVQKVRSLTRQIKKIREKLFSLDEELASRHTPDTED